MGGADCQNLMDLVFNSRTFCGARSSGRSEGSGDTASSWRG